MADCEYRINYGDKINVSGGEMFGATNRNLENPLCRVKAEYLEALPICGLPEAATEACPIAKIKQGKINLGQTNKPSTAIFEAKK